MVRWDIGGYGTFTTLHDGLLIMKIIYSTIRCAEDELHIEARFSDGQKYVIATIPPEHAKFANWLNAQINDGNVPCFSE